MKRIMQGFAVLAAVALLASPALAVKGKGGGGGNAGGGDSGTMNVQVRSTTVRSTPNYLGGAAGAVGYGQQVNVVGEQGNWYRIDKPAGWIPKADVTRHKVTVNPDQKFAGSGGKHDEVALAGKGFNPQVEAQYKKDNPDLAKAFVDVDRIEGFDVPEAQLVAFRKSGKLTPR